MMVRWTRKARCEFDDAFDHLFDANADAAMSWRSDVTGMMQMLEEHPRIGRLHRHEPNGDFREVVVGRYRFIYCLSPDLVEIRRILHVRRDYDPQRIRDGVFTGSPAFVPA